MKRIVAAIDFSDVTDTVIAAAEDLARMLGGAVVLFHVSPIVEPWVETTFESYTVRGTAGPDYAEAEARRREQLLSAYRDAIVAKGIGATIELAMGDAPSSICNALDALTPDMIVIGSHRHGMFHAVLLGDLCPRVVRRAPCPVLVVHPGDERPSQPPAGESEHRGAAAGP